MTYRVVKIDLAIQETNEALLRNKKPISHIIHKTFRTVNDAGQRDWKRKNRAVEQLLLWLLDHGFFKNIAQVLAITFTYNLDKLGKKDEEYIPIFLKHINEARKEFREKKLNGQ